MFFAALTSESSLWLHFRQRKVFLFSISFGYKTTRIALLRSEPGSTFFKVEPYQVVLYSSCLTSSYHPWSSMDLLSPDLDLTFLPGCSMVPFADLLICFTFRSSHTKRAWFLLNLVVSL